MGDGGSAGPGTTITAIYYQKCGGGGLVSTGRVLVCLWLDSLFVRVPRFLVDARYGCEILPECPFRIVFSPARLRSYWMIEHLDIGVRSGIAG